jgi:DtxR family Mn-dependent transcriptional regulator
MDELLGFPNIDPHGSPIPNKEGEIVKRNYKTLAECSVGTKVELKALRDSSTDFLLFLNKKEIHLGSEILIHQIESFDKSMTISYGDHSEQVLSNSISSRILVEAI